MSDYQHRLLATYYAQIPRLQAENRKLRRTVVLLLVVGTLQWALGWVG